MRPANDRVSASSLQTYEECPQKWVAQYANYIPTASGNTAANEGTALHYACEHFVYDTCIAKTRDWSDISALLAYYEEGYRQAFGTHNVDKTILKSAIKILKDWHKRTDLSSREVLSVESKKFHKITDINGNDTGIQLTYILDRCDFYEENGSKILRVVDYKSVRLRWTHDDLSKKIQPLVYAVAALIEHQDKKPDAIWVEMDLLRHNETVAIKFSRDDCIQGWRYLQRVVSEILSTDQEKAQYKLGSGCRFCPVKINCPSLNKNVDNGGSVGSIANMDIDSVVKMREELKAKIDGLSSLLEEANDSIFEFAKENDILSWSDEEFDIKLTSIGKRKITDMEIVAKTLGPEVMQREGKINVTDIDRLIKHGTISEEQANKIKPFIEKQYTAPTIKIEKKAAFTND